MINIQMSWIFVSNTGNIFEIYDHIGIHSLNTIFLLTKLIVEKIKISQKKWYISIIKNEEIIKKTSYNGTHTRFFKEITALEVNFVNDSDRLRAVGRQLNQRTNPDMDGGTRTGGTEERAKQRTIKLAPLLPDNDQPRSRLHLVFHTRRPSHHLFHRGLEGRGEEGAAYPVHRGFHWPPHDAIHSVGMNLHRSHKPATRII